MASVPIPQGAQLVPVNQAQGGSVPIPAGATLEPLDQQSQQQPSLWNRIKSALAPRDSMSMPGAARPTGSMPGSFEGHPENVGEYIPASAGEMYGGAKDIAQGNIARGGHRVLQGAGNATLPALPF